MSLSNGINLSLAHATDVFDPSTKRDYEQNVGFNFYQRMLLGKGIEIGEVGLGVPGEIVKGRHTGTIQSFATVTQVVRESSKVEKTSFNDGWSARITQVIGFILITLGMPVFWAIEGNPVITGLAFVVYVVLMACGAVGFISDKLQFLYWNRFRNLFSIPKTDHQMYLLNYVNTLLLDELCESRDRDELMSVLDRVLEQSPSNAEFNEWVSGLDVVTKFGKMTLSKVPTSITGMRKALEILKTAPEKQVGSRFMKGISDSDDAVVVTDSADFLSQPDQSMAGPFTL